MQPRFLLSVLFFNVMAFSAQAQNTFPASGNVGIGTTSPQRKLHIVDAAVQSGGYFKPFVAYTPSLATGQHVQIALGRSNSNYNQGEINFNLVGGTGSANNTLSFGIYGKPGIMTLQGTGKVGIGAASPAMALHVSQPADSSLLLLENQSSLSDFTNVGLYLKNGLYYTGALKTFGTGTNSARLSLLTYAANSPGYLKERFTILDNGNIGINTISPTFVLDVNGNGNFANDLHFGDKLYQGNLRLLSADYYNTFLGQYSAPSSTGSFNTGLGAHTLYEVTTGGGNTAVGSFALYSVNTAYGNTGVGSSALESTTNDYNTAVGDHAMASNTTGYWNTGLGFYADVSSNNLHNATAIGYRASVDATNKVRIGNTDVTSIGGQVGWTNFSDGRYKRNIREDVQGLSFINNLRPITYTVDVPALNAHYNKGRKAIKEDSVANKQRVAAERQSEEQAAKIVYNGFVAQEVEAAANKLHYNFSGVDKPQTDDGLYGLRYADFVVPLVKAVQELDTKTRRIEELERKNEALEQRMLKLEALLKTNGTSLSISGAFLEQASPNPAGSTTTIRYGVPDGAASARLTLTNAKGQVLKELSPSKGAGQVNLNTATLPSGTYTYTLWVDGRQADSKQLVIAK